MSKKVINYNGTWNYHNKLLGSVSKNENRKFTEKDLLDACRPLLNCLKLLSLTVNGAESTRSTKTERLLKIWRVFLVLLCICNTVQPLYCIFKVIKQMVTGKPADYQTILYLEPFIAILVMCSFVHRERQIGDLYLAIMRNSLELNPKLIVLFRRLSCTLAATCIVLLLLVSLFAVIRAILMDQESINIILRDYYLGIHFSDATKTYIFFFYQDAYYIFGNVSYVDFYSLFIVFLCYALYWYIRELNENIRSRQTLTCVDLQIIERQIQEFASLVRDVSRVFSPIIAIIIGALTIKLTFALKSTKVNQDEDSDSPVVLYHSMMLFGNLFQLVRSILLFTMLVIPAASIYEESQLTMELVTNTYLRTQTPINSDQSSRSCPSCHTTTLFLAHNLATPIGITGSNLFTINNRFILLVISSVVTYITVLS